MTEQRASNQISCIFRAGCERPDACAKEQCCQGLLINRIKAEAKRDVPDETLPASKPEQRPSKELAERLRALDFGVRMPPSVIEEAAEFLDSLTHEPDPALVTVWRAPEPEPLTLPKTPIASDNEWADYFKRQSEIWCYRFWTLQNERAPSPPTGWQPIETAPKDGTPILVCNDERDGAWIAYYCPVYQSGYRPENPWSSLMLNTRWHKNTWASYVPTRWMPIPAAYTSEAKPACDCEGPQKIGPEYHAPYCATMAGTEFAKRYAPTDETSNAPIYTYGLTLTEEDKKAILGGSDE